MGAAWNTVSALHWAVGLCLGETVLTSTERSVETNGVRLRVLEAGERGAPVVILAHGFPELAYSWRHQIPALAAAGYHVLAPDQRGYGGSSRPAAVGDYDITALTADLVGLLDDVGAERAVFVGHDWGATVAWNTPLLHPGRVAAVVGLSVPPVPRPQVPPTQAFKRMFGDHFFYMLYFQEPGVADADLDRDPGTTVRRMFTDPATALSNPPAESPSPRALPGWISQRELDRYTEQFTRTGFTGPLNWYRNLDRNWELTASTPADAITAPSLFIGGTDDPVLRFTRRDRAAEVVSGPYREVMIDGAGHWIQQQRPEDVNAELLSFLSALELR
ncbi:MAG: ephA [Mycobacterium sp.]|nr:ephA [Mycobacterium sp.]